MVRIISQYPVIAMLEEDVFECERLLSVTDSQFNRRCLIRSTFAYFEGTCDLIRKKTEAIMHSQHLKGGKKLNISRIILLRSSSFRITEKGDLKEEEQRQPYKNYMAFTLRSFAEESGIVDNLFIDDGWEKLQKSIKVRHRITHPKTDSELSITDEEIANLRKAKEWFLNFIRHVHTNATIKEL